jgi:hypothetical protein
MINKALTHLKEYQSLDTKEFNSLSDKDKREYAMLSIMDIGKARIDYSLDEYSELEYKKDYNAWYTVYRHYNN